MLSSLEQFGTEVKGKLLELDTVEVLQYPNLSVYSALFCPFLPSSIRDTN